MAGLLYALQRDLDMVTQDVQSLKKSYNILDYIAKVVHDVELEQLAQGAQMRRIEDEMKKMKEEISQMKEEISQIKEEISRIKDTLILITKHLGIQAA